MDKYCQDKSIIENYPLFIDGYDIMILPIKYEYFNDLFFDADVSLGSNRNLLASKNHSYQILKYYICNPYALKDKKYKLGDKLLIYVMGPELSEKKYTSQLIGEAILKDVTIEKSDNIDWTNISKRSIYDESSIKKDYKKHKELAIIEFLFLKIYKKNIPYIELKEKYNIKELRIFSPVEKTSYLNIIEDLNKE